MSWQKRRIIQYLRIRQFLTLPGYLAQYPILHLPCRINITWFKKIFFFYWVVCRHALVQNLNTVICSIAVVLSHKLLVHTPTATLVEQTVTNTSCRCLSEIHFPWALSMRNVASIGSGCRLIEGAMLPLFLISTINSGRLVWSVMRIRVVRILD